jgi:hypothetical protein
MRTLIYKRTHVGDPNVMGVFGIKDCMRGVRNYEYGAVVGIGGVGSEAKSYNIDERINWIGIGPHRKAVTGYKGEWITFDQFLYLEGQDKFLTNVAPVLAERMYTYPAPRFLFDDNFNAKEQAEVSKILRLAADAPPSTGVRIPKAAATDPKSYFCPPCTKHSGRKNNRICSCRD